MLDLSKVETAAALAAVSAVINASPPGLVSKSNPLATVEKKLEDHLKEFNA